MRRTLNYMVGALLGALLVMGIPFVLAAEGDTNLVNLVLSGDLTVDDDATITGDAAITGDLAVTGTLTGGGGNIGSEASPIPSIFATDLDVDDDLTVDDDALISGDLTVTGTTALNGHATLANTKDLLVATDGGSDLGASAAEFGTLWVQTIDDSDGTVAIAAAATVAGNVTVTGDVLPEADGTRALGASGTEYGTAWVQTLDDGDGSIALGAHLAPDTSATYTIGTTAAPMLGVYSKLVFTTPPALISASQGVEQFISLVTGASAAVTLTLPDAASADGMVACIILSDTTTNDVTVKSAGGTVGKTDRSAAGAAAGTGIVFTDTDDDKYACWASDATNWVVAMANATVD